MARDRRPKGHPHAGDDRRLIGRLVRSWRARVEVTGHSMEPTLRDGDWLLVDSLAYRARVPRVGDLVVAAGERWLVKRVAAIDENGALTLRGDHRAHTEEAVRVAGETIRGRPWFRYRPLRRLGRVR